MWFLTSATDDRVIYIVSPSEIFIGRSADVCNFAIPEDPSISRKHVSLTILDASLVLQDLGSRYGTFINNSTEKVEVNTNIKLNNNDVVKFGKMNSIWMVHAVNHVTCTSTLKGESLQDLRAVLSAIGGEYKSDWDDSCTYLTMPAITLTIKVVLALAQGSHIVTPDFWKKCLAAVNALTPLPDPNKYIPEVVESTLNREVVSFLPNLNRKSLFAGKKFIFFSKRQFEMYKTVLTKSSASPLLLSETRMTVSMLCEEDVIVIQYVPSISGQETQAQRNQINDIVNHLKNKGKRVIADAEIGLAILYCSIEKYCNPCFSFTSEVVKQNPEKSNKITNILAPESQEQNSNSGNKNGKVVIDESLVDDDKKNVFEDIEKVTAKRKLSEFTSEFEVNPNKKVATLCYIANVPTESSKRKHSEEDNDSNPSKKQALKEKQDNDDDIFNFVNASSSKNNQNTAKKLNLAQPQKRKLDNDSSDGLFNFVQSKDEVEAPAVKQSMFTIDRNRQDTSNTVRVKVETVTTPEDIAAMRGVKLKELMENKISYEDTKLLKVKKEKDIELEEKMSGLDLGCTIVVTSNDLIVKKEPLHIEALNTSVRNFKKFKKVWPLKKQVIVIPTSSMSIAT